MEVSSSPVSPLPLSAKCDSSSQYRCNHYNQHYLNWSLWKTSLEDGHVTQKHGKVQRDTHSQKTIIIMLLLKFFPANLWNCKEYHKLSRQGRQEQTLWAISSGPCTTRHWGSADLTVKELQKSWVAVLNVETPPLTSKGSQGPLCLIQLRGACLLSRGSRVQLFAIVWTGARQTALSVGFSRQEYWSGFPRLHRGVLNAENHRSSSDGTWDWTPRPMSLNHMFRWGGFGHLLITRLFLRLSKLQSCLNSSLKNREGLPSITHLLLLLLLSRFSRVQLCATPQTAAHWAPPYLGLSRQEHWSGLPFPSPMHESEKWKWSRSVVSDS